MIHRARALPLLALLVSLSACSAVVSPQAQDAAVDLPPSTDRSALQDVSVDDGGAACVFPSGARCERGQVCPSPDGCNSCRCSGGVLACTGLACADAGPAVCLWDADCAPGREECVFEVGACGAPGRCVSRSDCAEVALFCGCDGETLRGCASRPRRPARSAGPCASDAGAPPDVSCAGASIGPSGRDCLGPADGLLPVACCTGWSCDHRRALCESLPPSCPPGQVAAVTDGCWGPCVPASNCAPMRCLGEEACPPGWRCNDVDTCEYGR